VTAAQVLESDRYVAGEVETHAPGPEGRLPITPEMLLTQPSGYLFGLTQRRGWGGSLRGCSIPSF